MQLRDVFSINAQFDALVRFLLAAGSDLFFSVFASFDLSRFEAQTADLYRNSYILSGSGNVSLSRYASYLSDALFGSLFSKIWTTISDPTETPNAFSDATCCCASSANLDKALVVSLSKVGRFKSSDK